MLWCIWYTIYKNLLYLFIFYCCCVEQSARIKTDCSQIQHYNHWNIRSVKISMGICLKYDYIKYIDHLLLKLSQNIFLLWLKVCNWKTIKLFTEIYWLMLEIWHAAKFQLKKCWNNICILWWIFSQVFFVKIFFQALIYEIFIKNVFIPWVCRT